MKLSEVELQQKLLKVAEEMYGDIRMDTSESSTNMFLARMIAKMITEARKYPMVRE